MIPKERTTTRFLALNEKIEELTREIKLRKQAEEELRQYSARQASIINGLPTHITLVDKQGTIIAVNNAWEQFAQVNLFQDPNAGLTQNYLEICEKATGPCSEEAAHVAKGLRTILSGERSLFELEYPCHSPTEKRWFRVMISPVRSNNDVLGAVVMHVNVTRHKLAEMELLT